MDVSSEMCLKLSIWGWTFYCGECLLPRFQTEQSKDLEIFLYSSLADLKLLSPKFRCRFMGLASLLQISFAVPEMLIHLLQLLKLQGLL